MQHLPKYGIFVGCAGIFVANLVKNTDKIINWKQYNDVL